jgi:DNA-binding Lrp family transcriptional regulator
MDETDLRLFQLVSADARQSYREMAEKLGLTVQAVHRRMKAIEDEGILHCFTAHLSVPYLGAVPVYMSGISRATSVDAVLEGLRADDSVELVMTSSGSRLFICSLLRGISDLEPHLDIVRKAAMLEEPFPMGIEGVIQMGDRAISRPPRDPGADR